MKNIDTEEGSGFVGSVVGHVRRNPSHAVYFIIGVAVLTAIAIALN